MDPVTARSSEHILAVWKRGRRGGLFAQRLQGSEGGKDQARLELGQGSNMSLTALENGMFLLVAERQQRGTSRLVQWKLSGD